MTNGCTLVSGADQGQGAWCSWMKISTMSSTEVRNAMAIDPSFDPKKCYLIAQVAHIVCRKDHHEILSETVSNDLSTVHETLQALSLIFIRDSERSKVKSYYIPKHAIDICIEEDSNGFALTYYLHAGNDNGFSVKYSHDEKIKKGSIIVLIIPHFDLPDSWQHLHMMYLTDTVLLIEAMLMRQQCHRVWEELLAPDLMIAELRIFCFPNHFSSKKLAQVSISLATMLDKLIGG
jgi:hypothetical protein